MRGTIYQLLVGTAALTAVIPTERWFQLGAVKDVPPLPFAILKWLSPVRSDSGADMHQLQVAIYDKRGSYKKIDDLLGAPYRAGTSVYAVLSGVMDLTGVDGYVAQADYLGHSGDDVDVDFKANMKFSSWQIAGRSL
jgi:hypothetical protein